MRVPNSDAVAVIGWGSLIWRPGALRLRGGFQPAGPRLPVEFSRIAPDGRLTLVIDSEHGAEVRTHYAVSTVDLESTFEDLATRERAAEHHVGYLHVRAGHTSLHAYPHQEDFAEEIAEWCEVRGFAAAVWTALPATFESVLGTPFSVTEAISYLMGLDGEQRATAFEYLERAPTETETPLRAAFRAQFG